MTFLLLIFSAYYIGTSVSKLILVLQSVMLSVYKKTNKFGLWLAVPCCLSLMPFLHIAFSKLGF